MMRIVGMKDEPLNGPRHPLTDALDTFAAIKTWDAKSQRNLPELGISDGKQRSIKLRRILYISTN